MRDKAKNKVIVLVAIICTVLATSAVAYEASNTQVAQVRKEMASTIFVNLSQISIGTRSGILEFITPMADKNTTKQFGGPVTYIGLFNESDLDIKGEKPSFQNTWKVMVSNSTAREHQLMKSLVIGKNYTIWYINFIDLVKSNPHATMRVNCLVTAARLN